MDFAREEWQVSIHTLISMKHFFSVCRKMSGFPLKDYEVEILHKFLSGVHNQDPVCKVKAPLTWDVQILLDYFTNLPPNSILTFQELAGKLALLFLICSGCRIGEVFQIRLSCMKMVTVDNELVIEVHLSEPTKTFTWRRLNNMGLQKLTFRQIPGYEKLCPIETMLDYLRLTKDVRQTDALFVLQTGKPAARFTLVKWIKNHLKFAGLGDAPLHSTRSSVASGLMVMANMQLREICDRIGWQNVSTFIRNYMKPVVPQNVIQAKTAREAFINNWRRLPPRVHQRCYTHRNAAKKRVLKMQRKLAQKSVKKATSTIHKTAEKKQHLQGKSKSLVESQKEDKQRGKCLDNIPGLQNDDDAVNPPMLDMESIFDSSFWTSEMENIAQLIEEEEKIDRKGAYTQGRNSAQVVGSILQPYKDKLQQRTERFDNLKFVHISKINEAGKQEMQTVMSTRKLNPHKINRLATSTTTISSPLTSKSKSKKSSSPAYSTTMPLIDLTKRKVPVISESLSVVPAPKFQVPSALPVDKASFILSNFREGDTLNNPEGEKITIILDSDSD